MTAAWFEAVSNKLDVDNAVVSVLISQQQDKGNEKEEYILNVFRESVDGVNA